MIVFKLIVAQCLNDFERLLRQIDIDRLSRLLRKTFNAAHFLWLLWLSNHIELYIVLLYYKVAAIDFRIRLYNRIYCSLDLDVTNAAANVVKDVFDMLQTCCFH